MNLFSLLHQLAETHTLSLSQWETLISGQTPELAEEAARLARLAREPYYGKRVFIRGLIEISNFCKNDCYYCGIRRSNRNAMRYRLSPEQILSCCERDGRWDSAPLSCRVGRTPGLPMRECASWCARSKPAGRKRRLLFPLGSGKRPAIRRFGRLALTGICFAMKRRTTVIIAACTRRSFPLLTGWTVCGP